MKMAEYNSYPADMQEITRESDAWNDFFTYCKEDYESRQAYKNNLYEHHEDLRIAWVRKEKNIGFCIGRKQGILKFYKIGTEKDWDAFKHGFAAQFAHDNS